ncbi:MAG: TonB family protein [Hyphococcus sp.]
MSQEKAAEIIDLNASREAVENADSVAAALSGARRAAGLSLAVVSDATKVKIDHLEAIEASDFGALPAAPYAIGFVKSYAQFLGLDAEMVAGRFKTEIQADAPPPAPVSEHPGPASPAAGEGARMASIFGVIAILVFAVWIVVQIAGSAEDSRNNAANGAGEQRVRIGAAPAPAPQPRAREELPAPVAVETAAAPAPADGPAEVSSDVPADAAGDEIAAAGAPNVPTSEAPAPPVGQSGPVSVQGPEAPVDERPVETAIAVQPEETPAALVEAAVTEAFVAPTENRVGNRDADALVLSDAAPAPVERPAEPVERAAAETAPQPQPAPEIVDARLVRSIAPQYPNRCARSSAPLESVTVMFDVTAQGRAANIRVIDSTNGCFDNAAVSTLQRWRFDPKTVDGAPRPDLGKQATLNFRR